jgi:hypothetical protein
MAKPTRRCSEAFTVQGAWWDAAEPSTQLSGTLTWDPRSGAELELVGLFHQGNGPVGDWRSPILHGAAERDEFTLVNCAEMGFHLQSPGVPTQRIRAFGGVLVGAMVPDVTQSVFDSVTLEIDYLAELAGRSTPETRLESADGVHIDRVSIEYEHPRDVIAALPHETVRIASEWQTGGSAIGQAHIAETVVLSVDVAQPVPLDDLLGRYVGRLRDLVTLAGHRPAAIRSVRVAGPATMETRAGGRVVKRSAEFLAAFLPEPTPLEDLKRLDDGLFSFPSGDREFRSLLRSWFELAERVDAVLDLRFAPGYASFVYGESRFLNAAQAVEALHRRVLAGEPEPVDLDARAASIANCPAEHRKWLEEKLRYAVEPSLRRRLREILTFIGPGVDPLFDKRSKFIDEVVRTRNRVTHWDEKTKPVDGERLYRLAVALNFIVDAALLRLLSFDEEQVASTLVANRQFQFEASKVTR